MQITIVMQFGVCHVSTSNQHSQTHSDVRPNPVPLQALRMLCFPKLLSVQNFPDPNRPKPFTQKNNTLNRKPP